MNELGQSILFFEFKCEFRFDLLGNRSLEISELKEYVSRVFGKIVLAIIAMTYGKSLVLRR